MIRGLRYHERVQDEISEILSFYSAISGTNFPKPPTTPAYIPEDTTSMPAAGVEAICRVSLIIFCSGFPHH